MVISFLLCLSEVIETAFAGTFDKEDVHAFAASQKGEIGCVTGSIGAWWRGITTVEERKSWAVASPKRAHLARSSNFLAMKEC